MNMMYAMLVRPSSDETQLNEAIAKWLSFCLDKLQQGREREIPRNPFYRSTRGVITKDYVDRIIRIIDECFEHESKTYPAWHRQQSGSSVPPDFARLGEYGRRAVVEGCDRIMGFEDK